MKIVLTPDWFIGNDILIEFFSFIVLLLFTFFSIKNYKLDRTKRKFLYLGYGFGLIALAQLANVLTKLVLYYDFGGVAPSIGAAVVTSQVLSSVDIFYYTGFFFHKILTLAGLYVIYRLPRKKKSFVDWIVLAYFIVISLLIDKSVYYLFHMTALILLILIIEGYIRIYQKNKFKNTLVLILAFSALALSQLLYVISIYSYAFVIANLVELISYVVLLILIGRILYHGKEKKSDGHHLRHSGNNSRKRR
jgi:hypothetical protein